MFKKLIIILLALIILPVVHGDDQDVMIGNLFDQIPINACEQAAFCNGGYVKECSRTADGVWPEHYGDWSSCPDNNYEGYKCHPCDPDCGFCAEAEIFLTPNPVLPNSQIDIPTVIYKDNQNYEYWALYRRGEGFSAPGSFAARQCDEGEETCVFDDVYVISPAEGGKIFYVEVQIGPVVDNIFQISQSITLPGKTYPLLRINNPTQGSENEGDVNINIDAESNLIPPGQGLEQDPETIKEAKFYLHKYSNTQDDYLPTNTNTCSINCQGQDCNLIQSYTNYQIARNNDDEVEFDWDSTICDNNNYKLFVEISDSENTVNDEVEFTLTNPNAPCVDECSAFKSNIFKTILAKIKVWL